MASQFVRTDWNTVLAKVSRRRNDAKMGLV